MKNEGAHLLLLWYTLVSKGTCNGPTNTRIPEVLFESFSPFLDEDWVQVTWQIFLKSQIPSVFIMQTLQQGELLRIFARAHLLSWHLACKLWESVHSFKFYDHCCFAMFIHRVLYCPCPTSSWACVGKLCLSVHETEAERHRDT